jgi:hypothetical protein
MVSKRKSEKRGDVKSSQRQRVLASIGLQHKQEPTKKATERKKIYQVGFELLLESCMNTPLGAQRGEQAFRNITQSLLNLFSIYC